MATMGPFQTALRNDFKLQLEVHIRAAHNRFHNPKMPNREGEISPQTKLLLEIYVWLGGAAIVCLGSTPKHDEEGVGMCPSLTLTWLANTSITLTQL